MQARSDACPALLYLVTHPLTARLLLRGQLRRLGEAGFEVTLGCAGGAELEGVAAREGVQVRELPLRREMAPLHDLRALWAIGRLIRELRPAVVVAGTPKAGLLGMVGAAVMRVPTRVYVLRGLRLETTDGARRMLLWAAERVAAACATQILAVSASLRHAALELGLAPSDRVRVPGGGSSNGVDTVALTPEPATDGEARRVRQDLGIPLAAPVVGFVGRLVADKGVADLLEAVGLHVREQFPDARLLLVGATEPDDPLGGDAAAAIEAGAWVVVAGHREDVGPLYRIMNVVALPSYREGFPNVPLEAAACGRPVVAYEATGTVDAVVDGHTGTLVPRGDVRQLAAAICSYLADGSLAARHGHAGRDRVLRSFAREQVQDAWCAAILAAAAAADDDDEAAS